MFVFRIPPSGYAIEAPNDQDTILWDAASGMWTFGTTGGAVSSVFGRAGAVVAVTGDYDSDQIANVSGVAGASVSDALDTLQNATARAWALLRAIDNSNLVPSVGPSTLAALTGSAYELVGGGPFTSADSVITYTGTPTIEVLVTAVLTVAPTGGLTSWSAGVVSLNGDMIGSAVLDSVPHTTQQITNGLASSQQAPGAFGADDLRKSINLSMQRHCSLSTGDTLQIIAAQFVADSMVVVGYSLHVQQLPAQA